MAAADDPSVYQVKWNQLSLVSKVSVEKIPMNLVAFRWQMLLDRLLLELVLRQPLLMGQQVVC